MGWTYGVIRSVCTVNPGVPPERGAHLDRGVATPRSRCREVRHSSREFLKENPRFLFIIVFESNEAYNTLLSHDLNLDHETLFFKASAPTKSSQNTSIEVSKHLDRGVEIDTQSSGIFLEEFSTRVSQSHFMTPRSRCAPCSGGTPGSTVHTDLVMGEPK